MSKEILHNAQAKLSWSGSMTTFPVDFLNPKSMTHCTKKKKNGHRNSDKQYWVISSGNIPFQV